jgi:hypothetical protein
VDTQIPDIAEAPNEDDYERHLSDGQLWDNNSTGTAKCFRSISDFPMMGAKEWPLWR